jgi:hypothetical protein
MWGVLSSRGASETRLRTGLPNPRRRKGPIDSIVLELRCSCCNLRPGRLRMMKYSAFTRLLAFLMFIPCLSGAQTTPSLTLQANNVTMPSSGAGSIPVSLISVNGFAGTIYLSCTAPIEAAGVRVPICETGPAVGVVLSANATVQESVLLVASAPVPTPVKFNLPEYRGGVGLGLAGTLMLGLRLRRRRARRFARVYLSVALLAGLTALGACAGSPNTLTPGNYTYTLAATKQGDAAPSASAAVTVIVPSGIVVQ